MHYLYILRSTVASRHYIGTAKDLIIRLQQHNQKRVRSTKAFTPWEIIYQKECNSKKEALGIEWELKHNSWKRKDLFEKISQK